MISLSISGGGRNFPFLQSAASTCMKLGYMPSKIIGISSGALMAVPLALGMHGRLKHFGIHTPNSEVFSVMPTTKKGKISFAGIWRALRGKNSFGVQDTSKLIKRLVTRDSFEVYKAGPYPDVYTMSVNVNLGSRKVVAVRELTYEQYIDHVQASSRIPVMTQPQKIAAYHYIDGGVRHHNAGHYLIENFEGITKHISIYSRPMDFRIIDKEAHCNVVSMIERTIEIQTMEISRSDQYREEIECQKRGIELHQIFNPMRVHYYDDDIKKRRKLYNLGVQQALNAF